MHVCTCHVVNRYLDKYPALLKVLVDCEPGSSLTLLLHSLLAVGGVRWRKYLECCTFPIHLELVYCYCQVNNRPLFTTARAQEGESVSQGQIQTQTQTQTQCLSGLLKPYNTLGPCWLSDIGNLFFCQASCVRTRLRTSPRPPISGVVSSVSKYTRVSLRGFSVWPIGGSW